MTAAPEKSRAEELRALAAACETASAAMQGRLIEEAWELIAPTFSRDGLADRAGDFGLKMDARAYLDAAMSLVPEGWAWMAGCAPDEPFFATLSPTDESGIEAEMVDTLAATPALALCAAALRARAESEQ